MIGCKSGKKSKNILKRMSHEKPHGGPYKELFIDVNAEAVERMRKQIEADGKHGILIRENCKKGDETPEFVELLNKKIKPEDMVFYSPTTGKLEYVGSYPYKYGSHYRYENDRSALDIKSHEQDATNEQGASIDGFDLDKEKTHKQDKERHSYQEMLNLQKTFKAIEADIKVANDLTSRLDKQAIENIKNSLPDIVPHFQELKTSLNDLIKNLKNKLDSEK